MQKCFQYKLLSRIFFIKHNYNCIRAYIAAYIARRQYILMNHSRAKKNMIVQKLEISNNPVNVDSRSCIFQ